MTSLIRNRLANLYIALSTPVTLTEEDTVAEGLQSLNETVSLLCNRMKEKTDCRWKWLKHFLEKVAEEEAKEQQLQDDNEQYVTVPKIKLVYEWMLMEFFIVKGNLKWCQHEDGYG